MAEALGVVSSLVTILELSGHVLDYLHKVKDASKDSERIVLELCNLNGFLASLKELLARADSKETWLATVRSLAVPKGPIAQYEDALKRLASKLEPVVGLKKAGKAMRWPFEKKEVLHTLNNLERQKTMFMLALQNDSVKLALAVEDDVTNVKLGVSELRAGVRVLKENLKDEELQNIYRWLDPLAGESERKQADLLTLKGRQDCASKELMTTREFTNWMSGAQRTLWCSGAPGVGKTMFASAVVKRLRERFEQVDEVGIAFVYCNYKEAGKQSIANLMTSILHQFLVQISRNSDDADDLEKFFAKHGNGDIRPSSSAVLDLLGRSIDRLTKTYLVLDALDEYPMDWRTALLSNLQSLSPNLSILITSRPNVRPQLKGGVVLKIYARVTDMENYLNERIDDSEVLSLYVTGEASLRSFITGTIIKKANGMGRFLLARLHLDSLQTKTDRRKLKSALNSLPAGRDETYDQIMERIKSQAADYAELALKILMWVTVAKESLELEALRHILAIEPGDTSFDEEGLCDAGLMLSVCAGLIDIRHNRTVVLVHYTAQEYFNRKSNELFPEARTDIPRTCLTYLNLAHIKRHRNRSVAQYPGKGVSLYRHVVRHWADHLRGDPEEEQSSRDLALRYVTDKRCKALFVLEGLPLQRHSFPIPRYDSIIARKPVDVGLCVLAAWGLNRLLKRLLSTSSFDIVKKAYTLHVALSWAAYSGYYQTIDLLIASGAEVNYRSDVYGTALYYALDGKHRSTVLLLLKKGADINNALCPSPRECHTMDYHSASALHIAVMSDDLQIVRCCPDHGALLNQTNYRGFTAFHMAAESGSVSILHWLLKESQKTNVHTLLPESDSKSASCECQGPPSAMPSNISCLDIRDDKGNTPLHVAASHWFPDELVNQLLAAKVNIHAKNSFGETAVHILAKTWSEDRYPSLKPVQMLLTAGAEINDKNAHGYSLLHSATFVNNEEIIRFLLNHGADPNATDVVGATSLHYAATVRGNIGTVHLLIEGGGDLSAQDNEGQTPLHKAVGASGPLNMLVLHYLLDAAAVSERKESSSQPNVLEMEEQEILQCCYLDIGVLTKNNKGMTPMDIMEDNEKGYLSKIGSLDKSWYKVKSLLRQAVEIAQATTVTQPLDTALAGCNGSEDVAEVPPLMLI